MWTFIGKLTTCADVLHLSTAEIARRAGITERDAWYLTETAAKAVLPRHSCTALDALAHADIAQSNFISCDFLTSGCPVSLIERRKYQENSI